MTAAVPAPSGPSCNIASWLPEMARLQPGKSAVVVPDGRGADGRARWVSLDFAALDERSDRYGQALRLAGITRGTRTVLMVKPGLDFFALVFGLFKIGAVIVLVDPGLDRRALSQCLREAQPQAFVGIPLAQVFRLVFRKSLGTLRTVVTVGRRWFWGGDSLSELVARLGPGATEPALVPTAPTDEAAILFTSGSTGVPKGAVYTHGIFDQQVRFLRQMYAFGPDEIDLPTFPLFALFDPALGMTAVIPDMDARKPGKARPERILEAIEAHGCTTMFASPALLRNLGPYLRSRGIRLPTMRRVLSAGAPVPPPVLDDMAAVLPVGAQVFTPYGATESLPVCNVGSAEILASCAARTRAGDGICVGVPVTGVVVRIIGIRDDAIARWDEVEVLPAGRVGEITVRSPVVTERYFGRADLTALAKIREQLADGTQAVVHRMGDLGWFDEEGRLWMCGRKSHRVETAGGPLYTEPIEKIVEGVGGVARAALVGVGKRGGERPFVLIELTRGARWAEVSGAIATLAGEHSKLAAIERFVRYPGAFPVDIRHNAKIGRERLARWAAAQGWAR